MESVVSLFFVLPGPYLVVDKIWSQKLFWIFSNKFCLSKRSFPLEDTLFFSWSSLCLSRVRSPSLLIAHLPVPHFSTSCLPFMHCICRKKFPFQSRLTTGPEMSGTIQIYWHSKVCCWENVHSEHEQGNLFWGQKEILEFQRLFRLLLIVFAYIYLEHV